MERKRETESLPARWMLGNWENDLSTGHDFKYMILRGLSALHFMRMSIRFWWPFLMISLNPTHWMLSIVSFGISISERWANIGTERFEIMCWWRVFPAWMSLLYRVFLSPLGLNSPTITRSNRFSWKASRQLFHLQSATSIPCSIKDIGSVWFCIDEQLTISTDFPTSELVIPSKWLFIEVEGFSGDIISIGATFATGSSLSCGL